ncbi:MAG: hypothetical protein LBQ88_21695 [Treponema sp.]|nr:hypothetical protein [Treponema sp.]
MKNKLFVWVLFILAAFAVLALTGCATTTEGTNNGNFGENIRTPVKDFETLGLVFTESQLTVADKGSEGQILTYQALLKEAQALGADAIINVVIDKKIQVSSFPGSRITTWYGSALAIKYTATLTETGSVTVTADGVTTTTATTSVYFNDGGAPAAGSNAAQPSAGGQPPASVPARGIRQ